MPMKTVVIVDDSTFARTIVKLALIKEGYKVIGEAADGKSAIEMCMKLKPDFITLDNILPDMIGVEILQRLKEANLESNIIMASSLRSERVIEQVKKLGAIGYLRKPFEPHQLLSILNNIPVKKLRVA